MPAAWQAFRGADHVTGAARRRSRGRRPPPRKYAKCGPNVTLLEWASPGRGSRRRWQLVAGPCLSGSQPRFRLRPRWRLPPHPAIRWNLAPPRPADSQRGSVDFRHRHRLRFGLAHAAPQRIGHNHRFRRAVRPDENRRDVRQAFLGVILAHGPSAKTADPAGFVIVEKTLHRLILP